MNLFRIELHGLTFADLAAFCTQNIPEGARLDYKKEPSSTDPQKQIAKAVSALANTQGGVLVFGVGTHPGTNRPAWPSSGMPADSSFEARIVRWCIEHIDPPITPQVGYITHPSDSSKAFAVLRVEPSLFTPHTVDGGTRVYVRRADNSDPCDATIYEIELLRDRRRREMESHEKHFADLVERIAPPETRRERRCYSLVITPMFSTEDVIPFQGFPPLINELREAGFKIGDLRSYSHGLLAKHPDGFNLVVTGRAGLAYSRVLVPPSGAPPPIDLETLLGWSLLTATAVRTLAIQSGYWGTFCTWFEARNHGGIAVFDSQDLTRKYSPCADQRIELLEESSTTDARENSLALAGEIYTRLMWAFGQHAHMWSSNVIEARLRRLAGAGGIQLTL